MTNKIFIIGSERSGTNLLQKLLSNHDKLTGPKTPQLINTFYRQVRHFGDLNDEENQKKLYGSLLDICNHKFSNWCLDHPICEPLTSRYKFIEAIINLYKDKASINQKHGFVAKELNVHLFIDDILDLYPDTKFIHIVRNPLEQASSWMKTPLFYLTPDQVARDWVDVQQHILNQKSRLPSSILTCKYEDLVNNTSRVMTNILEFCDLNVDEKCFRNKTKREGDGWNELWKNVNNRINNDLDKHDQELLQGEIKTIQNITGDIAFELGYFKPVYYSIGFKDRLNRQFRILKSRIRRKNIIGVDTTFDRVKFSNNIKRKIKEEYFYAEGN